MAIVQTNGGGTKIIEGDSLSVDPFGFDEITRVVLVNGNAGAFSNEFKLGAVHPSYNNMYCCGPQGSFQSRPGGWIKGPVKWKGFSQSTDRYNLTSFTMTTRETQLPIVTVRPNGSQYVRYASPPWSPTGPNPTPYLNPKTGTYWKVVLTDRLQGVRIQGATIGTPNVIPPLPTYSGAAPQRDPNDRWENLDDPTYYFPFGWVLKDYQPASQFAVGNVALYFWTAYFQYVNRAGP